MPNQLLLVTGSRALNVTAKSREWAEDLIRGAVAEARKRGPLWVFSGGAKDSPDRWASVIAEGASVPWVEYRTDGFRYERSFLAGVKQAITKRPFFEGSVYPLKRNEMLIAAAAKTVEAGWDVRVLGIVAPWSVTHGTEHTLGLAAKAKLQTSTHWAPEKPEML